MKDLYKPVFWCGFALSLSALYAGAEKLASGPEDFIQKPVLMQISIGEPVLTEVDLGTREEIREINENPESSPQGQRQTQSDLTPPLPNKGSAFYEAAKAAMESR